MSVDQIQHAYILYIGAGAVAAGGIISLIRSMPLIWHGIKGGFADLRDGARGKGHGRADRSGPLDEMGDRRNHLPARARSCSRRNSICASTC